MFGVELSFGIWYITAREYENENLLSAQAVGKLVQAERKRQGLTQLQLAGLANTGIRFVSDLENGKETVQLKKLLAVLAAFGLGLFIHSPWDEI